MDFKRIRNFCVLFIIVSFIVPAMVIAQEKSESLTKRPHPRDSYPPDQRPEENYLARFKAIDVSQKLMKDNLEDIYMLKVVTANFSGQGWEKDYDEIYNDYKKAVSYYYRRQVIYSQLELEKNKKKISDLFKKIVVVYNDQTHTMLEQCADKILNFSLDERNKFDPNRSRVLFQNMMRLWIAYGQIDDADRSVEDYFYKNSIYHLRIAKGYAISIMEELDPDNSVGKYKVHKADNLNRILSETAQSNSPGSSTGSGTTK